MVKFAGKVCLLCASAGIALLPEAVYAQSAAAASDSAVSRPDDIVVTARRRSESAQSTPLAVTALSAAQLNQAGVKEIKDLSTVVPGVNFSGSGGFANSVFSIRGVSRTPIGNVQPSVGTYVNEVALPQLGANIPTYDVASVQVVKGPQGTLFGRNTTAGAVLVTTVQPSGDLEGFVEGTLGKYDWRQFTGALNLPIIGDKVALRLAGQVARRDGYTQNLSFPGNDLDAIHRESYRASLLLQPFDGFKNVLVYEHLHVNDFGSGIVPVSFDPTSPTGIAINRLYNISGQLALLGGDKRKALSDVDLRQRVSADLITNTTTWDLGGVTLKNIFGYRSFKAFLFNNIDGLASPFVNAQSNFDQRQITEELNLSGTGLGGNLDWIAGLYYLDFRPTGPQRIATQIFAPQGTPFVSPRPLGGNGSADFYYDRSKAAYGQIGYNLGGLASALDGLKIDLGYRYTRDTEKACNIPAQTATAAPPSPGDCLGGQIVNGFRGTVAKQKFSASTYTIGLNYQATSDVLLYAVTRRGYRAGGVNTPVLAASLSPFQTFEPEIVQDVELGLKTSFHIDQVSGRFNVAAFRSRFDNLIAGDSTGSNPNPDGDGNPANNPSNTQLFVNLGKAMVRGIELEGSIRPLPGFELSGTASWIDKKVTDLATVPTFVGVTPLTKQTAGYAAFLGAPNHTYGLRASYELPISDSAGQIILSASWFRTGTIRFNLIQTDPWSKTDFRIDWNDIFGSSIDAGFLLSNAFNKLGIVAQGFPSNAAYKSGIYNEPRIYSLTVRYRFGA